MTDLEHRTAPPTGTAAEVAGRALLLHRLARLLEWVGDGCGVPGAGPNGALAIAAAAPLVGGSATTVLGYPRTRLEQEPLLERAWRALVAVRFVLPRGTRARTSAAGRRWLAATGDERERGDATLVRAYLEEVLAVRRPLEEPWDAGWPEGGEPDEDGWLEDERWASEDDACGCTPCVLAREEAWRRVAHGSRLQLATALADLCRGGELVPEDWRPSGTDNALAMGALDVARELQLLVRAGLLHERSPDGPVFLDASLAPAVRSGLRRWARRCGARLPL